MKKIAFLFFFTAFCFAQQPLLSLDKLWADEVYSRTTKVDSLNEEWNALHCT